MTETAGTPPDGLPSPQRRWAMAVVWIGIAMSVLDTSIANVALPTLSKELNASASQSIWVVNAYQLGMMTVLLPLAAVSERLGYKRIYLTGMALFAAASAVCVMATTLPVLAIGRALQGIGAAGVMGMNAGLLRRILPHRLMGRALGANAFIIASVTAAAPSVASIIVHLGGWRWLFAINAPFCIFTLLAGVFVLPSNELAERRFDWISALLSMNLFGALVVGADLVGRAADVRLGAGLLLLAALCALLAVRRSWNQTAPLFPVDLLRIPIFGLSILTSCTSFCAGMIAGVAMPFLFQQGLHRDVLQTGLLLTPWPVGTALASMAAGYLADKAPSAVLNSAGLLVMAAGLFLLAVMPADTDNLGIIWRTALCGAGFGFFQSPNNRTLVLSTPRTRGGATGGVMATARTTGQAMGAVTVALLFHLASIATAGRWCLAVAGVLSMAAAGVSSLRLGQKLPSEAPSPIDEAEAAAEA
jgi:DHA2 family multidrug resistance protein-like MFS transporter